MTTVTQDGTPINEDNARVAPVLPEFDRFVAVRANGWFPQFEATGGSRPGTIEVNADAFNLLVAEYDRLFGQVGGWIALRALHERFIGR